MAIEDADVQRPRDRHTRWPAVVIAAVAWTILGIAYWLHPSATGMETHKSLGLPSCGLLTVTRIPCPTCGYTTAFSAAAHGHLLDAFRIQPAGASLAILTAAAALLTTYSVAVGMPLRPIGEIIFRPRVFIVAAAVVIAAWVYKIVLVCGGTA